MSLLKLCRTDVVASSIRVIPAVIYSIFILHMTLMNRTIYPDHIFYGLFWELKNHIFNVPFYYELNHNKQNNNDRIIQLSNVFDLNNYEIKNADATGLGEYDWKTINIKMKDYRNNSLDILFDSLREE